MSSPFGLSLRGVRENVRRMPAIGAPVTRRLIAIYTVSAAMAGVAGGLLAQTTQFVGLDVFGFPRSADLMIMLVLGGAGRLYGGLIGATVFMIAHHYLSDLNPVYWQFWLGLLLVVVVMFARGGILGALDGLREPVREVAVVTPALSTRGLSKHFGAFKANTDVTLEFPQGARHALIGPNGAGKTTLINLLTGVLPADVRRRVPRRRADHRIAAARARQARHDAHVPDQHAVRRTHRPRVGDARGLRAARAVQASGIVRWRSSAPKPTRHWNCCACCGLATEANTLTRDLPYGKQRLVEIALALATKPRILLLDEPAAGIPAGESAELFAVIAALPKDVTILFIEHDMELVFRFAERITVLVGGQVLTEGTPAEIAADPRVREVYLGEAQHG